MFSTSREKVVYASKEASDQLLTTIKKIFSQRYMRSQDSLTLDQGLENAVRFRPVTSYD